MKPLLVGEQNPYQGDPDRAQRYALYPYPLGCAGHRLCHKVMGLTEDEYLERFDRVNLCAGHWSIVEARATANRIRVEQDREAPLVMLGSKVCSAFSVDYVPFRWGNLFDLVVVCLPHPSGLSRAWNEPGAFERARAVLREAGVL